MFKEFHKQNAFLKSLNNTFLVLLPKKGGTKELGDFRPISLLGGLYKLLANTLANNLYSPPKRLIGLKSPSSSAPLFFGKRTRNVLLRLSRKEFCSWNSVNISKTSSFMNSQQHCQKATVKPSGLGALSPFMSIRAE